MTDRKSLPFVESDAMDRRSILLLACAACGACTGPVDNDGGESGVDAATDLGVDVPPREDGEVPDGEDSGKDAGPVCNEDDLGTNLGPVSMFPLGMWVKIRTPNLIVAHDDAGLFVYSGICTHFGVTLPAPMGASGTSTCPIALGGHGSIYDSEGRVLRQPNNGGVSRNLDHFRLTVCDGNVWVATGSANVVPLDTRTPAE